MDQYESIELIQVQNNINENLVEIESQNSEKKEFLIENQPEQELIQQNEFLIIESTQQELNDEPKEENMSENIYQENLVSFEDIPNQNDSLSQQPEQIFPEIIQNSNILPVEENTEKEEIENKIIESKKELKNLAQSQEKFDKIVQEFTKQFIEENKQEIILVPKSESFIDNLKRVEEKMEHTKQFCELFETSLISENADDSFSKLIENNNSINCNLLDTESTTIEENVKDRIDSTLQSTQEFENILNKHLDNIIDEISNEQKKIHQSLNLELDMIKSQTSEVTNITNSNSPSDNHDEIQEDEHLNIDELSLKLENNINKHDLNDDTLSLEPLKPLLTSSFMSTTGSLPQAETSFLTAEENEQNLSNKTLNLEEVNSCSLKTSSSTTSFFTATTQSQVKDKRSGSIVTASSNYLTAADDLSINNQAQQNMSTSDSFYSAQSATKDKSNNLDSLASSYSCVNNSSFASLNSSYSTLNNSTDLDQEIDMDTTCVSDSVEPSSVNKQLNAQETSQFNVECFLKNMYPLVHHESDQDLKAKSNLLDTSSHSTLTAEESIESNTNKTTESFTIITKEDLLNTTDTEYVIPEMQSIITACSSSSSSPSSSSSIAKALLKKQLLNSGSLNSLDSNEQLKQSNSFSRSSGGSGDNVSYTSSVLEFEKLEAQCEQDRQLNDEIEEQQEFTTTTTTTTGYDSILLHDLNTIYESFEKETTSSNEEKDILVVKSKSNQDLVILSNENENESNIPQSNSDSLNQVLDDSSFSCLKRTTTTTTTSTSASTSPLSSPSVKHREITKQSVLSSRSSSSSSIKSTDSFETEIKHKFKIDESSFFARKKREKQISPPTVETVAEDEISSTIIEKNAKTTKQTIDSGQSSMSSSQVTSSQQISSYDSSLTTSFTSEIGLQMSNNSKKTNSRRTSRTSSSASSSSSISINESSSKSTNSSLSTVVNVLSKQQQQQSPSSIFSAEDLPSFKKAL